MEVIFLHTDASIRPQAGVELLAAVDGKTIRVSIDWPALERLLGTSMIDEAAVREFLRQKRDRIELAVRAHLFAQGVPLNRQLALSFDELRDLGTTAARQANR